MIDYRHWCEEVPGDPAAPAQSDLHVIFGGGQRGPEVAGEMAERIKAVIAEYNDRGIPLATGVGVLDIVKVELMAAATG